MRSECDSVKYSYFDLKITLERDAKINDIF